MRFCGHRPCKARAADTGFAGVVRRGRQMKDGDMDLKSLVRTIPDYPKPGIMFRDITTLILDPRGFTAAVDALVECVAGNRITKVAGIEARGFILGGAIAHRMSVG